jgi:hypothetical protein
VSYLTIKSYVSQDTLFYSLDDFELHYYHRDKDHQSLNEYELPFLNSAGELFSAASKGLKIFLIASKSSVDIKEFRKDLSIFASYDGLSCLVFATLEGGKQSLSAWSVGDEHIVELANNLPFSVATKGFNLGKSIAVLTVHQLYFNTKNSFTKYRTNISDCSYYSDTKIVCLTSDS